MSDENNANSQGSNIIVSDTQELWDYKADPAYAEAVAKTTEYVSGVIDIMALVIFFVGKSSVATFHWLAETGTQAVALGNQANELYYEKGLNDKVARLVGAVRGKIDDFRESRSSVYTLDDASVSSEPDDRSENEHGGMAA
ncbi:MAG: hypothetical protein AAF268_02525 [Cyanobacteria bacterium P01_A01_bin.3]